MPKENFRNYNTTVLKTVAVLRLFNRDNIELSLSAIAAELDYPASTTHRIVSTLVYTGLMYQNPDNGKYRLGIGCYQIGSYVQYGTELGDTAMPHILELSKKYDELVNFLTHDNSGRLVLIRQNRPKRSFVATLNENRELQVSASGKCMMAYMRKEELENTIAQLSFKPYTPNSIRSAEALMIELAKIQQRGYSTEREEGETGLYCCSAPIFAGRECVATISLSLPLFRLGEREPEIIADVISSAEKITKKIN